MSRLAKSDDFKALDNDHERYNPTFVQPRLLITPTIKKVH